MPKPARGRRRAGRCGRSRACRASSRRPRRRRTSSAPTCRRSSERVRLRDVAREREHQRHGVLGGGDDVRLRRVGDDDAALGRRLDVDVVDADAGAADHLQVVGAVDQVGGQLAWPSGSGSRGSRRCARRAPRRSSRRRGRRRSARAGCRTPESAIFSLTRTLYCSVEHVLTPAARDAGLEEHALRGADAGAVLDLVAELGEHHLEPGQRGQDVEGAEVAAVGDPQDPALELVLAAVGGDAELAQARPGPCRRRSSSGSSTAVTTVERSSGSPNRSSPSAAAPARVARASRSWRARTFSRPSSSIMSSATSRPRNSDTAGVNGLVALRAGPWRSCPSRSSSGRRAAAPA